MIDAAASHAVLVIIEWVHWPEDFRNGAEWVLAVVPLLGHKQLI
jgi:hypothetical protein